MNTPKYILWIGIAKEHIDRENLYQNRFISAALSDSSTARKEKTLIKPLYMDECIIGVGMIVLELEQCKHLTEKNVYPLPVLQQLIKKVDVVQVALRISGMPERLIEDLVKVYHHIT